MSRQRTWLAVVLSGLALLGGCVQENEAAASGGQPIEKGGDNRTGEYDPAPVGWWKPAPDQDSIWRWGQVSGLVADTPDRIIVGITGDRNAAGQVRPNRWDPLESTCRHASLSIL